MSKDKVFFSTIYTLCMTLNVLGQQGHSGRQGAVRIYHNLLKKI